MGTEAAWVPWVVGALSVASAGTSYYNTEKTADRQDAALADSIINQSRKQREADARVGEEVQKLEGSTAADERAERLAQYMDVVGRNRDSLQAGLVPGVGSDRFQADAQGSAAAAESYAGKMADLMARVDAGSLQRQREGFGYGRLATDLSRVAREASGQSFLDELRLRGIRRNPWLDAAAAGMSGAAGAMGSGASGANAANTGQGVTASGYRGLGSLGY